jgi:hypothetical protein
MNRLAAAAVSPLTRAVNGRVSGFAALAAIMAMRSDGIPNPRIVTAAHSSASSPRIRVIRGSLSSPSPSPMARALSRRYPGLL